MEKVPVCRPVQCASQLSLTQKAHSAESLPKVLNRAIHVAVAVLKGVKTQTVHGFKGL